MSQYCNVSMSKITTFSVNGAPQGPALCRPCRGSARVSTLHQWLAPPAKLCRRSAATFLALLLLAISWASSPLAAAPRSAADDDLPVAEGPAEEPAKPAEKAPPAEEDDDELLK